MTTLATAAAPTARPALPAATRIWRIVKLQLTNRWNIIALPWIILGVILVLNLVLDFIITTSARASGSSDDVNYNSSSMAFIFVYMLVVAIQAINLTFPFALGYGVTRRDYYLGSALTWLILSASLTAGFTLLSYIEEWTGGWGLDAQFFRMQYVVEGSLGQRLFVIFVLFLFFFFVGTISAAIYVRWKVNGLLAAGLIVALLVVGSVALATVTQSWPAVGAWFVASGVVGVVAWTLVPSVLAAVTGYFILRRATPKS